MTTYDNYEDIMEERLEDVLYERNKQRKKIKNKAEYVESMETEESLRDIEDQNCALRANR